MVSRSIECLALQLAAVGKSFFIFIASSAEGLMNGAFSIAKGKTSFTSFMLEFGLSNYLFNISSAPVQFSGTPMPMYFKAFSIKKEAVRSSGSSASTS